jgi:enterochelin esterase family protein
VSGNSTAINARLQSLPGEIARGNKNTLQVFWEDIAKCGTPLIEPIDGHDKHSLVTFLWRSKELAGVDLLSLLTPSTDRAMKHLPGTDVWFKSLPLPNDLRATYQFYLTDQSDSDDESEDIQARLARMVRDPLNPNNFAFFTDREDPTGVKLVRSVLEMPAAPPQPWIEPRQGIPKGQITRYHISSQVLGNERRLWVYTPPNYSSQRKEDLALLILFDGWGYLELIPTTTILDNLIAEARLPPLVAVMVDSLSLQIRLRELVFHDPFNRFLVEELLPWIHNKYHVTSDPARIVVGGASAGGLAAAYAALEHPHTFGNILSQSGAFAFSPPGDDEHEWLTRQFTERQRLPLKFYLEAGSMEVNSLRDRGDAPNLLIANQNLHNVLKNRGYEVHYKQFSGGHDYISWRGTLGDGLQALLHG